MFYELWRGAVPTTNQADKNSQNEEGQQMLRQWQCSLQWYFQRTLTTSLGLTVLPSTPVRAAGGRQGKWRGP